MSGSIVVTTSNVRRAHVQTVRTSLADQVGFLQGMLGQKTVAYLAAVENAKTAGRWARGLQSPRLEHEERIRIAYQVWHLLATRDSEHTVRAWFVGLNPQLDDVSPLRALHGGDVTDVMSAARAFMAGG